MSEYSDKTAVDLTASADKSNASRGAERRLHPRAPFIAPAEIYEPSSKARLAGRCSDLSVGGCYVDTLSPLAVGTVVKVRIVHESRAFEASAVVAYAHVALGMGLTFTEIRAENQEILRSWVAGLRIESPPERTAPPPERVGESAHANGDIRFILNELITLLLRKKIVTEDEAMVLLRQMFR